MNGKNLIIPGFTRYRINTETKEVQSKALGKQWRNIKPHRNGLIRLVSDDRTNEYAGTPIRILYAAQRGINPAKMGRDLSVVEINGELVLLDRKALIEQKAKNRKPRNVEVAKAEYNNAIDFCRCVLAAYETNDYTPIVTRIWQKRDEVVKYIRANNICLVEENINEIWMQAFDITLNHIRNNHTFICNLSAYLKRVVRSLHLQKVKIDKMIRSYDKPETKLSRMIY